MNHDLEVIKRLLRHSDEVIRKSDLPVTVALTFSLTQLFFTFLAKRNPQFVDDVLTAINDEILGEENR